MSSLLLLVMLVFIVLFAIAVPTVIADVKSQRQKGIEKEY
jgi:type II secretory pathway pseudopilin PulG